MYCVDSHCHLDMLNLPQGQAISDVLSEAQEAKVGHILSIGVDPKKMATIFEIVENHSGVSASCGMHPLGVKDDYTVDHQELLEKASHPKVIAIGETGLDYYYHPEWAEAQKESFAVNIDVAKQLTKPLILHTRNARQDTIDILKASQAESVGGVIHCFTEDLAWAKQALDLGFYISFSGIVTFNNADQIREVAKYVPSDRYLVETDSPYLAPKPHRGKQNIPAYVVNVAEFVAKLRDIEPEQVHEETTNNFERLFLKGQQIPLLAN